MVTFNSASITCLLTSLSSDKHQSIWQSIGFQTFSKTDTKESIFKKQSLVTRVLQKPTITVKAQNSILMNDHPPSLQPMVQAIVGFFISISILIIPLLLVSLERVKSTNEPTLSSFYSGENEEDA